MLRTLRTRLYRERRRALIVAALTFAAGAISMSGGLDASRPLVPVLLPLVAVGLGFLIVFTPFLMVIALILPFMRSGAEASALMLLVYTALGVIPLQGDEASAGHPLMSWGFGIFLLLYLVYTTEWTDRWLPAHCAIFHSRARSNLPPEALFPALALTPETAAQRGDPNLVEVVWSQPGRVVRVESRQTRLATVTEHQTIEAMEAPHHSRRRFETPRAAPWARSASGIIDYRLHPHRGGTELQSTRIYDRTSHRARLLAWIDDSFGRDDDRDIARIERAARG